MAQRRLGAKPYAGFLLGAEAEGKILIAKSFGADFRAPTSADITGKWPLVLDHPHAARRSETVAPNKARSMRKKLMGCPAWLKLSDDKTSVIFVPDRAETVRRIFEASISGIGCYVIAKQFNSQGVPPLGPSPKWDKSTIYKILCNRATIGEFQPRRRDDNGRYVPDGLPVANFYPAVIEERLFLAAQETLRNNLTFRRGRKGRLFTDVFREILTCAYCNSTLKFKSRSGVKSIICSRVIDRVGCHRIAWSYQDFEKSVFDFIRTHEQDSTFTQREREALAELSGRIRAVSGQDVYSARMAIWIMLKASVAELKVASGGAVPQLSNPDARIRLDLPGRYFEITFHGGSAHKCFAA
jgi:recombinase